MHRRISMMSSLGALIALVVFSAVPASAKLIVWNFDSPIGVLGTTQDYKSGGFTITAHGFDSKATPTFLFGKNLGGDETGLGLANDPTGEGEIAVGEGFVQLDVSKLIASNLVHGLLLQDSVTGADMYSVFGSNILGSLGVPLIVNSTLEKTFFALPGFGKFDFYSIEATGGNVLVGQAAASTPEPATIALLAVALLLGAPFVARRRDSLLN